MKHLIRQVGLQKTLILSLPPSVCVSVSVSFIHPFLLFSFSAFLCFPYSLSSPSSLFLSLYFFFHLPLLSFSDQLPFILCLCFLCLAFSSLSVCSYFPFQIFANFIYRKRSSLFCQEFNMEKKITGMVQREYD